MIVFYNHVIVVVVVVVVVKVTPLSLIICVVLRHYNNELNDGVVSYEWDPTTTVFQLTLNLCGYLDTSLPSNALYVTLSLKDSCCDCSVTGIVCDFCGICYTLGDYCQCQGSCCTAYQS